MAHAARHRQYFCKHTGSGFTGLTHTSEVVSFLVFSRFISVAFTTFCFLSSSSCCKKAEKLVLGVIKELHEN